MKKVLPVFMLIFLLPAAAAAQDYVAVVPFGAVDSLRDDEQSFRDLLEVKLNNDGLPIVTRDFGGILQEAGFQRESGLIDDATMARIGSATGAKYVVYGTFERTWGRYVITCSLMEVTSGRLAGSGRSAIETLSYATVNAAVAELAQQMLQNRAAAAVQDYVAVVPFGVTGSLRGDEQTFRNMLRAELDKSGMPVVTRDFGGILQEAGFQRESGLIDDATMAEIGSATGAKYIVYGSFKNIWNSYVIACSLIEIETGSLSSSAETNFEAIGYDSVSRAVSELVGQLTGGGGGRNVAGMVFVQGGSFEMGSTSGDSDEKPVHSVTVSDFYISEHEVTQAEWRQVMGSSPSSFNGDNLPVESVSWYEAVEYCNKRSLREGLTPAYRNLGGDNVTVDWRADGYRLPTEAEWEYAARGGRQGQYVGGIYSGGSSLDSVGWYDDNSGGRTHEVKQKQANALGLYDMSGNVWEWCWDWHNSGYYQSSPSADPRGPASGSYRVRRGGSWNYDASSCRVAIRYYSTPSIRSFILGLRVARSRSR